MRRNRVILTAALLVLGGLLGGPVSAADYPSKPLQIICAFSAGSDVDVAARVIADIGSRHFGQPLVVVNKGGASGTIAASEVINANADGYTALWAAHGYFATTYRTQKIPINVHDLVPVANFYELKIGIAVRADSPFKTLDDLLNYARKNPGQLKWAHQGRGIALHLNTLAIFKKAGVKTVEVPYKGSGECATALLGRHVQASSMPMGPVQDQVKAGNVRFLVFFTDKRYEDYPSVPTATELGYPDAAMPTYFGLYVRKETPAPIKQRLVDLSKLISQDPVFIKAVAKLGGRAKFGGPEVLAAIIKKQAEVGVPMLKELGLLIDNK
jgi:tripartite-type tricarboxylate transporter receptor subunit TctC